MFFNVTVTKVSSLQAKLIIISLNKNSYNLQTKKCYAIEL